MSLKKLKTKYTNILVVSGTGRNTGKTTFVCKLIKKFKNQRCIAVKISSHFHSLPQDADFVVNTENYQVIVEGDADGKKDSQKMLEAGAKKVFYVQSKDESLPEVLKYIQINKEQPFIFESGAIARYLPDALHVCFSGNKQYKPCRQPDFTLIQESPQLDSFLESIQFEDNKFTVYANT